ncbi:zgc:153031 isoform X2 [Micropterus dolomieu]|uniref:zgc:153031 isoform X2 n=1 Tax=Micropterus dolomieu TaxID=147949 RepID=UPI001E8E6B34|nr:zgc:153031 isoform X2 [Micropterus dolomieu]
METSRDKVQEKPIRLIAAVCNNMGIGKDGKLPWHLPSEFQYFLNTVMKVSRPGKMNMMIWGKLCWYSHPENMFPLANILHVVLSTTLKTVPDHAHFLCQDFESAIRLAAQPPLADLIETIWIVGGTQVYKAIRDLAIQSHQGALLFWSSRCQQRARTEWSESKRRTRKSETKTKESHDL